MVHNACRSDDVQTLFLEDWNRQTDFWTKLWTFVLEILGVHN